MRINAILRTGSNRPLWNTKICYNHLTGTKIIDLLRITDRKWFAHFFVRKNFGEKLNISIVFPRISLLVHINDILIPDFKGRNLGFWKSTPTQAHRVGCLLQPRGAVGKTSISEAQCDNCCGRFNPRLLLLFVFFIFYSLNFTGSAPIGQCYAQNLATPAWGEGPAWERRGNEDIVRLVRRTENRIVKLHRKLTTTKQSNKIYIVPSSVWAHGFDQKCRVFGNFDLFAPKHRQHAWKYTPNFQEGSKKTVVFGWDWTPSFGNL